MEASEIFVENILYCESPEQTFCLEFKYRQSLVKLLFFCLIKTKLGELQQADSLQIFTTLYLSITDNLCFE